MQKFEEKLTELNKNEAIKKAKEILSKAKDDVLRQNEAIVTDVKEKAAAVRNAVGTVAEKVGSAVSTAAEPVRQMGEKIKPYVPDISESEMVKQVSKTVSEAEEKLLENTNVYQYGGFKSKELRDKTKAKMQGNMAAGPEAMPQSSTEADPEYETLALIIGTESLRSGASMVVHKESQWATKWNNFVSNNQLVQKFFGMKRTYEESNNMFVYFAREITNSISDRFGKRSP